MKFSAYAEVIEETISTCMCLVAQQLHEQTVWLDILSDHQLLHGLRRVKDASDLLQEIRLENCSMEVN